MQVKSFALGLLLLSLIMAGCGSSNKIPLGRVEGVITVDGQPLDGAEIVFEPTNGRSSVGWTDEKGHYELDYTMETKGAILGTHVVRIKSARSASGGEGDGPKVEARKEILPGKYHTSSTLTAEVTKGNNVIDFALGTK